jgi:C-terminal processing protease CtpA/Prc
MGEEGQERLAPGLGLALSSLNDRITIREIAAGSPAARCGELQVNDELVSINGRHLQVMFAGDR